ncbi:hypothetical protein CC78DRAFT_263539 [Lojkania enalia]|uniref:Secreted protein n=1 Tax=Lojkania enalia TaxID=147567 RepID=A0A9P4K898_9PLEO|nr:hypothetical protein CC78DRAFT_263539 [Didymosphaeria enalia]
MYVFKAFFSIFHLRAALLEIDITMCIRLIEKYAVCGCIYYVHAVDPCKFYGRHAVVEQVVYVGSSCKDHA